MRVRLKDIARDLGLSTVTVSKVLRGHKDISERTRELVLQRMRALNYRPNLSARNLASGRSFAAGLVVPDLVHPFFAEFAKSLSEALRPSGIVVMLASSQEEPHVEQNEIDALLSRGVDVLLLASCQAISSPTVPNPQGDDTPFLLIDRDLPDLSLSFVGSNNVHVGELAAQHLLDTGRRRIAHIGGPAISPSLDRLQGYRQALAAAGVQVPSTYVIQQTHVEEAGDRAGYQAMQRLLRLAERPDAVFCYNDLTALGAISATLAEGLRVPEDIAFVGCGNLRYADYLDVPLSSIDHHTGRLGEAAAAMALELIAAPQQPSRKVLLEPELVIRRSSLRS